MRPVLMSSGPLFQVGTDMGPHYPHEHWLRNTNVYVNRKHQRESETITSAAQAQPRKAQAPRQSIRENPIPSSPNRIKKGDRIVYAWNREADEYYAGTVIRISARRRDVTIKWDDNTSDTLYARNLSSDKYGVTWWYESDITHSPHDGRRRSRRARKTVNYAEHGEKYGYQPGEEIFVHGRKALVTQRRGKTVTFEYEDTHEISTLKLN